MSRAEEAMNALQEREEIYRSMVDQAADSIVLFDAETLEFTEFNDTACRELGYTREEFAALRLPDIQGILDPAELPVRVAAMVRAGRGTFENQHRCKDGTIRHCRVSNRVVRIHGRNYVTAVWIDTTDRKTAEARLAELNRDLQLKVAELEAIRDTVPIGIAISDNADCTKITYNPAFAGMLNIPVGRNCAMRAPEGERFDSYRFLRDGRELAIDELPMEEAASRGIVIHNREFDVVRDDGVTVHLCGNTAPLFDEQGRTRGAVGAFWDIGDRKNVEAAMLKAREAAESANRAKSEFLANMSHEIRTPMTAILGFADLLADADLSSDERHEFLQGIRRNGAALIKLIDDILDLSRIEAGEFTVQQTDCPLQPIIDDVVATARISAEAKGLSLTVEHESRLPATIYTDPSRLRQILVNLVGNAVKFTHHGGVRLILRHTDREGGRPQMRFTVSDTGCGIPANTIDRLFQPFTQVDASASRRHGGAGLGLSISRRLAEALGGSIDVTSELGQGSAFTLRLDIGQGDKHIRTTPPAADATEQPAERNAVISGRVLLVEDDADVQRIICRFLHNANLEVDLANNGLAACESAELSRQERRPYDLILMDIQMPEMNGYEATRELRKRGWQGPIIALTAHAMTGDREKCLAAGCDDYIAKPAAVFGLKTILTQYLSPRPTNAISAGNAGRET